jgi:adenosyl cobinamide kinase/adenosyl cobinamide phosphate guanylyltransferase
MGELTFITGPVRSGKSQRAVELATRWGSDTVFVATYQTEFFDKSAGDVSALTKMNVQIAGE